MLGDIRGWPRLLHNASKQVKSASTPKRHEARLRKRSEYTWYRRSYRLEYTVCISDQIPVMPLLQGSLSLACLHTRYNAVVLLRSVSFK